MHLERVVFFLVFLILAEQCNVCIKHVYICVAGKNVLAAPNCKKKQLFGKHKTFLHDVYEKSPFFKNDFILYLKEGGLSLLKIKQN